MQRQFVSAVLAVALALAHALPSRAADLASEPVATPGERGGLFGRCGYLNNIWLFGDPTDCVADETVPTCDSPSVVKAALRFANRAEDAYRVPAVTRFEPVSEETDRWLNPSLLVRRYCVGRAALDNGDIATAYYFVEEDAGFVGLAWKVYVCILGYDEWRIYDGRCRVATVVPFD